MELIVTEIVKIIKSETNIIKREKALLVFFLNLIRDLMSLALEDEGISFLVCFSFKSIIREKDSFF